MKLQCSFYEYIIILKNFFKTFQQVIKEERTKLRKEIQELKNKESEHLLKIKQLENDILIKNVESNSAYILMDENQELKQKLSLYENLFQDETKPE